MSETISDRLEKLRREARAQAQEEVEAMLKALPPGAQARAREDLARSEIPELTRTAPVTLPRFKRGERKLQLPEVVTRKEREKKRLKQETRPPREESLTEKGT